MTSTPSLVRGARLTSALLLIALAGCGGNGGEEVTSRSLARARRQWEQAKIRDYNIEWTTSGARSNRYRVYVRNDEVRSVRMVQPDGSEVEGRSAQPRFFGVDGLFRVMEEELEQAQAENPFGQPKGTRVVLRFQPDPKLGYPRSYHRDVLGSPQRLSLDVVRLDPNPPSTIPPLASKSDAGDRYQPPAVGVR